MKFSILWPLLFLWNKTRNIFWLTSLNMAFTLKRWCLFYIIRQFLFFVFHRIFFYIYLMKIIHYYFHYYINREYFSSLIFEFIYIIYNTSLNTRKKRRKNRNAFVNNLIVDLFLWVSSNLSKYLIQTVLRKEAIGK